MLLKLLMMNKTGGTMEGWMYGLMLAMIFVVIFTAVVLPSMNTTHGGIMLLKDYQPQHYKIH